MDMGYVFLLAMVAITIVVYFVTHKKLVAGRFIDLLNKAVVIVWMPIFAYIVYIIPGIGDKLIVITVLAGVWIIYCGASGFIKKVEELKNAGKDCKKFNYSYPFKMISKGSILICIAGVIGFLTTPILGGEMFAAVVAILSFALSALFFYASKKEEKQ